MLRRLVLSVVVVLALPLEVWAQTPTLVQYAGSARDNASSSAGTYSAVLPNATLSGNCLTFAVQYDGSPTVTSVTTDKGDTMTIGPSILDATNNHRVAWYRGIATAGTTRVNMVIGNGGGTEAMFIAEWYNTDCTSDTTGSSATKSQALTTTVSGDLIVQYGDVTSALVPSLTSAAANCSGNGGQCTLLQTNFFHGHVAQYKIGGASGSDTMAFTTSGADTWQSVSMALKKASTGTAPSATGIRVKSINCEHYTTTTHTAQFPTSGNLLIGMWTSADTLLSALSSSPSNTWSTGNAHTNTGQNGQIFYAGNATTSNTLTISPTYASADTGGFDLMCLLDVSGAATAPHDQDTTTTGNSTSGTTVTLENHTPTTTNGLVVNEVVWFQSTVTVVSSPSGAQYAGAALNSANNNICAPQNTSASSLNEDDGRGLFYNPNTSTVAFQYTFQTCATGVGVWVSVTSSFKAAAVSANNCTRTLLKAGC